MDPSVSAMYKVDGRQSISEEECIQSFPLGYRFKPNDEQLVSYYLIRKIKNLQLPPLARIREVDLYKFPTPDNVVEKYPLIEDRESEWYFFTQVTKMSVNGSRASRTTPGGHWKGNAGDAPVRSNGRTIGQKKTFCFYKGPNPGKKTDWLMHEFRINNGIWVLCKIFKKNVGSTTATTSQRAIVQVPQDANEQQQQQNEEPGYPIVPAYNANELQQQQNEEPVYPVVPAYNANELQQQQNEKLVYPIFSAYNANELQQQQNEEPVYPIVPAYYANELRQQQNEEPVYSIVPAYYANELRQQQNEEPVYPIVPAYYANELRQQQNEEPLCPIVPAYYANELRQQQNEEPVYPIVPAYYANELQQQQNEEPVYPIVPAYNANELQQPIITQQNQDFFSADFNVDEFMQEMEEFSFNLRSEVTGSVPPSS